MNVYPNRRRTRRNRPGEPGFTLESLLRRLRMCESGSTRDRARNLGIPITGSRATSVRIPLNQYRNRRTTCRSALSLLESVCIKESCAHGG